MLSPQILLVEDDYEDVVIVESLLQRQTRFSSALKHCESLHDAMDFLGKNQQTDLILLDLNLRDSFGIDSFNQIHQQFPQLPLIVLSGNTDETIALEALKEGAQDYLVKGRFDDDVLSRSIAYAIERQERHLELAYKNQALEELSRQLEAANHQLEQLAATDGLTRILNRRRFDELFVNEWDRAAREGNPLSVIMCDVDYFKAYNDTYGHLAGDRCLQEVAHAIARAAKRPADIVARYGGEEFIVALPNTDLVGATHVAEAIREEILSLNLPHTTSSISHQVTISCGVASVMPEIKLQPSQLIEIADQALYLAKEQGRNRICFLKHERIRNEWNSRSTLKWVVHLREALEKNKFQLYAQPINSLHTKHDRAHYEILLRLQDSSGQFIAPSCFFPYAERYDFLTRIDQWVIDRLFNAVQQHTHHHSWADSQFFINLSSKTCCDPNFGDFIEERLRHYHLSPENFCFEVPETVTSYHLTKVSSLMENLRTMNCQVALDDFGNGMTSFIHLQKIPVDYVKIDGLFVRNIGDDLISRAIVETIHHIAKLMNLQTIAEFVETQNIVQSLQQMGVDYAQGHFFSQAKPLGHLLTPTTF